jgi:DNA-binding transcriptional regulator YhcF (GntR family)
MDNKYKNKPQGKFWINNELVDNYLNKISGNELKVWLKITRHFNKEGTCFPSIRKMTKVLNLHHSTITKCLKKLEVLGFLEQLEIKEKCKLRYIFSKSARYLMPEYKKLLVNPDTKEDIKEASKEDNNNLNNTKRTPEEQKSIDATLYKTRKDLESKRII